MGRQKKSDKGETGVKFGSGWMGVALALFLAAPQAAAIDLPVRDRVEILAVPALAPMALGGAKTGAAAFLAREPAVEQVGLGHAGPRFCAGVGTAHEDLLLTHVPLSEPDMASCRREGVTPIAVRLGSAGLYLSGPAEWADVPLTRRDLFLALARDIPQGASGQLGPNPNLRWRDISPDLPDLPIAVTGPAPNSLEGELLVVLLLAEGAKKFEGLARLADRSPQDFWQIVDTLRSDGAYRIVAAPGQETAVLQILPLPGGAAPDAAKAVLQLDGVLPSAATLEDLSYPAAHPVLLYVKREHLAMIKDLDRLLSFWLADENIGPEGAFSAYGLVPMAAQARQAQRSVLPGRPPER